MVPILAARKSCSINGAFNSIASETDQQINIRTSIRLFIARNLVHMNKLISIIYRNELESGEREAITRAAEFGFCSGF